MRTGRFMNANKHSLTSSAQSERFDREDFSEGYLFFDYDGHQKNLSKYDEKDALEQMLMSFDNETENGKLYISYPMVEALRDFEPGICGKKRIF